MEKFFKFVAYALFAAIITTMLVTLLSSCSSTKGNYWTSTKVCDAVRRDFIGYK